MNEQNTNKETNQNTNSNQNVELTLSVKAQDGSVICFKLKKNTVLKKLMDSYCQRNGLNIRGVRFIYEGERIKETDTPENLNMEDKDEIDAMVEQHGGAI